VKTITEATIKQLQGEDGKTGRAVLTLAAPPPRFKLSFIVDGLVSVFDQKPNEFKVRVLLIAQVLLPTDRDDADARSIADTVARAVAKTQVPDKVDALLKKIIEIFFSDWKLVWVAVEG